MSDLPLIQQCLDKALDDEAARSYGALNNIGARKRTLFRALEIACEMHDARAEEAAGTIAALESDAHKLADALADANEHIAELQRNVEAER